MTVTMTFPGLTITRVLRLTFQKIHINRTQRISSLILKKPLCNPNCYRKVTSDYRSSVGFGKAHSVFTQVRAMGALSPLDPSSFSRPELAVVKHISLSLNVNFDSKVLNGVATLDIDVLDNVSEVILDSSKLNIESVETGDGKSLKFHIGEEVLNYGSKLTITLKQAAQYGDKIKIRIKYSTSPAASALQWLEPEQTSGKILPYMFSQCQPIHARSIIPCQDTPAVKFTYDAQVTTAPEFTVLMSALRGDVTSNTTSFTQPMPLPAYLVAIAVGPLESKYLGPRSRVWSEKDALDKSAWEFGDTERYLQAAEKLCGKYEWTEYDLLVLPPSFPYGGMENPCLTFVTPTLLAGDRSLSDVIVHEIMHSWTGNLITNRNFEHFWLNEGFTVYLERKVTASLIQDPVEAKKTRDFYSILGLQELQEAVLIELGVDSPLTQLVVDLNGTHPDDAFSTVPYEKGSLFLRYLEDLVGEEVFDEFLRSYLSVFSKKSLDTNDFKTYLYKYFKGDNRLDSIDWDAWLYKPGMPPVIPNYDTSMTKSVDSLAERVAANYTFARIDVVDFIPQQMIYLLQKLVDGNPVPVHSLHSLETEYKLGESKNAEIQFRWMRICIRSQDQSKLDQVFNFVNSQGRMKYVRPIYRDLYAWDYARELAIANFLKNEKNMMHVSAYTLRKDLHLKD